MRTGRDVDDPDVRMYAGAVIGAMVLVTPVADEDELPSMPDEMVGPMLDRLAHLDRLVTLPPV